MSSNLVGALYQYLVRSQNVTDSCRLGRICTSYFPHHMEVWGPKWWNAPDSAWLNMPHNGVPGGKRVTVPTVCTVDCSVTCVTVTLLTAIPHSLISFPLSSVSVLPRRKMLQKKLMKTSAVHLTHSVSLLICKYKASTAPVQIWLRPVRQPHKVLEWFHMPPSEPHRAHNNCVWQVEMSSHLQFFLFPIWCLEILTISKYSPNKIVPPDDTFERA